MEFVIKDVEFDYGHRVPNHKSKCKNAHGHRGKLQVVLEGPLVTQPGASDQGMVMDFGDIKVALLEVARLFDHRFIVWKDDPMKEIFGRNLITESIQRNSLGLIYTVNHFGIVQELEVIPTAENIAWLGYGLLSAALDRGNIKVVEVRFFETPNSCATHRPDSYAGA